MLPRPLGAATYQTLIGLLAVTGMRVGEAIRLDRDDLDADHDGLLRVRHSKFGKSRLVPLHPSTVTALLLYRRPVRPPGWVAQAGDGATPRWWTTSPSVTGYGGACAFGCLRGVPAGLRLDFPRAARAG
jgi:integrase